MMTIKNTFEGNRLEDSGLTPGPASGRFLFFVYNIVVFIRTGKSLLHTDSMHLYIQLYYVLVLLTKAANWFD